MANLGTLVTFTEQRELAPLNVYAATAATGTPQVASNNTGKYAQARPVAWWRGPPVGYVSVIGPTAGNDLSYMLKYPDNGQLVGVTEQTFSRVGRVKVGVFYFPTMTMIGWATSDSPGPGNWTLGYRGSTNQPMTLTALDRGDIGNYFAVALDPGRVFNLSGFDILTPVG